MSPQFPGSRILRAAYLAAMTYLAAISLALAVAAAVYIAGHSWIIGAGSATVAVMTARLMAQVRDGYRSWVADLSIDLDETPADGEAL